MLRNRAIITWVLFAVATGPALAADSPAPGTLGRVVEGRVLVDRDSVVSAGPLTAPGTFRTSGAEATIELANGRRLVLGPNTGVTLTPAGDTGVRVEVHVGVVATVDRGGKVRSAGHGSRFVLEPLPGAEPAPPAGGLTTIGLRGH